MKKFPKTPKQALGLALEIIGSFKYTSKTIVLMCCPKDASDAFIEEVMQALVERKYIIHYVPETGYYDLVAEGKARSMDDVIVDLYRRFPEVLPYRLVNTKPPPKPRPKKLSPADIDAKAQDIPSFTLRVLLEITQTIDRVGRMGDGTLVGLVHQRLSRIPDCPAQPQGIHMHIAELVALNLLDRDYKDRVKVTRVGEAITNHYLND